MTEQVLFLRRSGGEHPGSKRACGSEWSPFAHRPFLAHDLQVQGIDPDGLLRTVDHSGTKHV